MADSTSAHTRRRIGGDVYLTPLPHASSAEWRVDIGFSVAEWKAAVPGDSQQAAFPGTALLIADRWYEICHAEPMAGAPNRTAYDLRPWDDAAVIRHAFELTEPACDALTLSHRERQRRQQRGGLLSLLPFLTGLLPAEDQTRLELELGVAAARATMISALPLLMVSIATLMTTVALGLGTHFGELHETISRIVAFWPIAFYLALESLGRMSSAGGNEPMGSLPVCLPIAAFRALRGLSTPREQAPEKLAAKPPAAGMLAARDEVHLLDHPEYDLEVVSRLPKDHWTANVTGIEYQGQSYILVERKLIDTANGPRHHFLLQKPRHEVLFKTYVRYHPEEVRDIYRAQQVAKTATWVETFAFLWGLTSSTTQMRLAQIYNYDPERWTRGTIFGCAVLGAALAFNSARLVVGGGGQVLGFVLGVFLVWEAALRWSKLRAGEVRGSLFGALFEPLAKRCLRWE